MTVRVWACVFYCTVELSIAQGVAKLHGTIADIAGGEDASMRLVMQLRQIACDGEWMPAELDQWRSGGGSTQLIGSIVNRIANIAVILRGSETAEVVFEARTDERGEFDFGKITPGKYELEINYHDKNWVGDKQLVLREGFVTEAGMAWGTANCITSAPVR